MAQNQDLAISIVRHLMEEAGQTPESLELTNPNDLAAHIAKKFSLTINMLASEPAPGIPLSALWDEYAHEYPLGFTSSDRLAMSIANFIDDTFGAVKANPLATPYHPIPDAAALVVHKHKLWHFRDAVGNDALQARVVTSLTKIWQRRFEMLNEPTRHNFIDRDSSPSPLAMKPSLIVRLRIRPAALAKATGKTKTQKHKRNYHNGESPSKRIRRKYAPISYAEEDEEEENGDGGPIRHGYLAHCRRSTAPTINYPEEDIDNDAGSVTPPQTEHNNVRQRNAIEVVDTDNEDHENDLELHSETASNSSFSPASSQETPLTTPPQSSPVVKAMDSPPVLSQLPRPDKGCPQPNVVYDKNKRICTCRLPEEGRSMLMCQADGGCRAKRWYHADCVGWSSKEIVSIVIFVCPTCDKKGLGRTLTKEIRLGYQRLGKI